MKLHDNSGKFQKLLRDIKALNALSVTVGVNSEDAAREGDKYNNAQIGAVHEFGAPDHHPPIPPRPWLRPGVKAAQPEVIAVAKAGINAMVDGSLRPRDVAAQMGEVATASVLARIAAGIGPALSPATILRRLRSTKKGRRIVNAGLRAARASVMGLAIGAKSGFARFQRGAGGANQFRGGKWVASAGKAKAKSLAALQQAMGGNFTPLHDTGALVGAIHYKVRRK